MVNLYYLVAAIAYGIFIVQFILSWFGGDTDLDVDLDGEFDMDVSDVVSFKGLIHFLMGSFGWLSIKNMTSEVQWYDFLIALVIGILFVVILYYLYKLCLKLQHLVIPEEGTALVGRVGTMNIPGETQCTIILEINGMLQSIEAYPEAVAKEYKSGEQVTITRFEQGKYYFN